MARGDLFKKLLGEKQAAAATEAVEQLDETLEEAGIEHKALSSMDAGSVANALVDVMKSDLSDEDKLGAVEDLIKDLLPAELLTETEEKASSDGPDEPDDEDEDDDEDVTDKGLDFVAKMIDDMAAVTESQQAIEAQIKAHDAQFEAFDAVAQRLDAIEKLVVKALKSRPRSASRDESTVVDEKSITSGMEELMTEYEIDPLFKVPVKKPTGA